MLAIKRFASTSKGAGRVSSKFNIIPGALAKALINSVWIVRQRRVCICGADAEASVKNLKKISYWEDIEMKKAIIAGLTLTMTLSFAAAAMADEKSQFPQPDFMSELEEIGAVSSIGPEPGTKIEFTTKDLNGNEIDSASLFGQADVTMVNVWQTGCYPCVEELPELQKLADEYADKGCQVVTYCIDTVNDDTINRASELTSDCSFVTLVQNSDLDNAVEIEATPTSYFVNRDGVLLGQPVEAALVNYYGRFFDFFLENSTDANAADTQELSVKKTAARADKAADKYIINVVDQDGNPVADVNATLCTDSACNLVKSDEKGVITFSGEPYAYHINILQLPDGYSFDSAEELHTPDQFGSMTVTVHKD